MSHDLILGYCGDYEFDMIEPFLASWRRNCPEVELCLFQTNLDAAFHVAARKLRIRCEDPRPFESAGMHPRSGRYLMYRSLLSANKMMWDRVMLTDVRDVIFQGNPFSGRLPTPVVFAAEQMTIGRCPHNSTWLEALFGRELLSELAEQTISCSGTTFGSADGIAAYLDMMCALMEAVHFDLGWYGLDQGFHNFLLWKIRPDWAFLDRSDQFVATLGYSADSDIAVGHDGIAVAGIRPPVIPQWDRRNTLREYVIKNPRFRRPSNI
jgi:hypothetical protein